MPHPFAPLPRFLLLACGLLALSLQAQAGDGHGRLPTRAAKPLQATASAPPAEMITETADAAASAPPLPKPILTMDDLRQRLQDKMARAAPAAAGTAPAAPPPSAVGSSQDLILRVAPAPAVHAEPPARSARKAASKGGHDAVPHWGYGGEGSPANWGQLKPEFATCANGNRQSPIDIRGGIRVELEPIQFDYRPVSFQVVDNGHTVQANLAPGNSIVVGGRRYELMQFHFHRPSEESINGRRFEMVAHLVHKDAEGRLAVVAVLMDQGKAHPMVQLVWNSLPLEQTETVQAPVPIDMTLMLPDDRRYYTYMGSLTTPPCSEGVRWMVLKQPAALSSDQIGIFARLYPMNARPTQQAAGRLIKESN